MIKGIGTDIIEIKRIEKAMLAKGFKDKVFTKSEIILIDEKGIPSAATNFATKEAVSKALGTGIRQFSISDIEVLRDDLGKPYVIFHNKAKEIINKYGIINVQVSMSHCKEYAVAFVIIETR